MKGPTTKRIETVEEYLRAQSPAARATLEKVRKAIRATVPTAEEVMSYQIPTFKLNGPVAAFAAFKDHCSYYTMSFGVINEFKEELKGYDSSGVTIRFPFGKPLPAALIKRLVLSKMRENEARLVARTKKKATSKTKKNNKT